MVYDKSYNITEYIKAASDIYKHIYTEREIIVLDACFPDTVKLFLEF